MEERRMATAQDLLRRADIVEPGVIDTVPVTERVSAFIRTRVPPAVAEPIVDLILILRAIVLAFVSGARWVLPPFAMLLAAQLILRRRSRPIAERTGG